MIICCQSESTCVYHVSQGPSLVHCHANTHTHTHTFSLSLSLSLSFTFFLSHTHTHNTTQDPLQPRETPQLARVSRSLTPLIRFLACCSSTVDVSVCRSLPIEFRVCQVINRRPFLTLENFKTPYQGFVQVVWIRALSGGLFYPLEHYFIDAIGDSFPGAPLS